MFTNCLQLWMLSSKVTTTSAYGDTRLETSSALVTTPSAPRETGALLFSRQRDDEGGPHARNTRGGDLAPVALDDLAADRQPHTGALVGRPPVQPLERREDAFQVPLVEAYPVVLDD